MFYFQFSHSLFLSHYYLLVKAKLYDALKVLKSLLGIFRSSQLNVLVSEFQVNSRISDVCHHVSQIVRNLHREPWLVRPLSFILLGRSFVGVVCVIAVSTKLLKLPAKNRVTDRLNKFIKVKSVLPTKYVLLEFFHSYLDPSLVQQLVNCSGRNIASSFCIKPIKTLFNVQEVLKF